MRVPFTTVFIQNSDGSLNPRQRIRVGGVELDPMVRISSGVSFGGVDFTQFVGHDLEVEIDGEVFVVKGIY